MLHQTVLEVFVLVLRRLGLLQLEVKRQTGVYPQLDNFYHDGQTLDAMIDCDKTLDKYPETSIESPIFLVTNTSNTPDNTRPMTIGKC